MIWEELTEGSCGASAGIAGVDPNLVWADASGFSDFGPAGAPPELLPVLVELKRDVERPCELLRAELGEQKGGSVPSIYAARDVHYCTALFTPRYCKEVLAQGDHGVGGMIERFELQLPVVPQRAPPRPPGLRRDEPEAAQRPRAGRTLVGVIDSGCPFANFLLRDATGRNTRLLSLWDQNEASSLANVGGTLPRDLGYGCEIDRDKLNALMKKHRSGNVIDEDGCYLEAGDRLLRRRLLHGAAVLGLLAGPRTLGARREAEPGVPPEWTPADDEASRADIVFVQLPREAVQDSSSGALARHLLDGIHYILSCASDETTRIVINISDASSRGSHDGESIFERALVELVPMQPSPRELHVVLSSGNSFDERRHAQAGFPGKGKSVVREVVLRLSPGSETPSQVLVRVPPGGDTIAFRLVPPGVGSKPSPWVSAGRAYGFFSKNRVACGVVFPELPDAGAGLALLAFNPTMPSDLRQEPAVTGDWKIQVRARAGSPEVHLHIARAQRNIESLQRAFQARFVDVDGSYDPGRPLRRATQDPSPPHSAIRRKGSLSALATAASGRGITVVGSYVMRGKGTSPYSSSGPALSAGGRQRTGPDLLAAGDESPALEGIRSMGGRSGEVVRVKGTSFAAPQVARVLVNKGALPPLAPAPQPAEPERVGKGLLPP
jgi:hypothetical protein